jgi:hypothetical protein
VMALLLLVAFVWLTCRCSVGSWRTLRCVEGARRGVYGSTQLGGVPKPWFRPLLFISSSARAPFSFKRWTQIKIHKTNVCSISFYANSFRIFSSLFQLTENHIKNRVDVHRQFLAARLLTQRSFLQCAKLQETGTKRYLPLTVYRGRHSSVLVSLISKSPNGPTW